MFISVYSEKNSPVSRFARVVAEMLKMNDVRIIEKPDVPLNSTKADPQCGFNCVLQADQSVLQLLDYPYTDQMLYGRTQSEIAQITRGANIRVKKEDIVQLHDTRPQGLIATLNYYKVQPKRVLIIGTQSSAAAAALACKWKNAKEIHIYNSVGYGDPTMGWKGITVAEGVYDLVIHAMKHDDPRIDDIPRTVFTSNTTVMDMAVKSGRTRLESVAAECKCTVINGQIPVALHTAFAFHQLGQTPPSPQDIITALFPS